MAGGKVWTKQEEEYLADSWGYVSVDSLAKRLGRSENAIIIRKTRMNLGAFLESGDYVTFNQLRIALGITGGSGYMDISWIKNKSFPAKYKRVNGNRFKIVYLDDFWKWAESNQRMLDFSKFEKNALGLEPDWADKKRREDFRRNYKYIKTPWTAAEDDALIHLVKKQQYSYKEISQKIMRTEGAVQRRLCDLGIKYRPIKADNHTPWTDYEIDLLTDMIKFGCQYEDIAEKLGRGVKAIRGFVFRMYLTENLDKVCKLMDGGQFGHNRPERTVAQRNVMNTKERAELKDLMSRLAGVLLFEVKKHFKDSDYWQKDMCMNWDERYGCKCNQFNCDSCTSFIRIRPQYCVRCGGEFFERQTSRICMSCRDMRKKQAQRKFMSLNKNFEECEENEIMQS